MSEAEPFSKYCADVAALYLDLSEKHSSPKTPDVGRSLDEPGTNHAPSPESRSDCSSNKSRGLWDRFRRAFKIDPPYPNARHDWFKRARLAIDRADKRDPQRASKAGTSIPRAATQQTAKPRRWFFFRLADTTLTQNRRSKLTERITADSTLLADLLHSFDRGDETYFLYLVHQLVRIRDWRVENKLNLRSSVEGGAHIRPWDEFEEDQKEIIEKAHRTAAQFESTSDQAHTVAKPSDSKTSDNVKNVAICLENLRRLQFLRSIIECTRSMPDTQRSSDACCIEQLAHQVLFTEDPAARQQLIAKLFISPKSQCRLGILLGAPPSRWLCEEESIYIQRRRQLHAARCTRENSLFGVSFSGGGIRSATFNLGVLQALAELKLLSHIDYLATVSGGGYIHQWLASWLWRSAGGTSASSADSSAVRTTPSEAFDIVASALVAQPQSPSPAVEPPQISFLRRFSNYLTPEVGVFSADTWTMFAIWARNTFLNQLILASAFLIFFGLLQGLFGRLESLVCGDRPLFLTATLSLVSFAFSVSFVSANIRSVRTSLDDETVQSRSEFGNLQAALAIAILLISAVSLTTLWLRHNFPFQLKATAPGAWISSPLLSPLGQPLLAALILWPLFEGWEGFAQVQFEKAHLDNTPVARLLKRAIRFGNAFVAGAATFAAVCGLAQLLRIAARSGWLKQLLRSTNPCITALVSHVLTNAKFLPDFALMLVPPVLVAALFLSSVLYAGLNRRIFRDELLEWMARLRAWGFLISIAWLLFAGCLILAAPLVTVLINLDTKAWTALVSSAWVLISGGGAYASRSQASNQIIERGRQLLVQTAPFVFIAGILLATCAIVHLVATAPDGILWNHWNILMAVSLVVFIAYGFGVDINEFSMFAFYRNRLARCYQGASVPDRRPDPFTGFSPDDRAITIGQLRFQLSDEKASRTPWIEDPTPAPESVDNVSDTTEYSGPFPIFCCTANFTSGEDLAYQERKGASFAYTPLYSGYDIPWTGIDRKDDYKLFYNGFRDTWDLGHPKGPGLADACASSGAAASPIWGYRTSPATAFLMTYFNVRLGAWRRNTRFATRGSGAQRSNSPADAFQSPAFGPLHLFHELFGMANIKNKFLYLTDGGHFDNMGLYELVRRGCRNIIVSDAEQDGGLTFEGFSMALRKCRTDFGVEIDIDLRDLRKSSASGNSGTHCAVGTILYPHEDPNAPRRSRGKIVYLKSALTGEEPADILGYSIKHPAFPHDSTADQWFSESQFESYRVLGRHIAMTSLSPASSGAPLGVTSKCQNNVIDDAFTKLYDVWYPAAPAIERHLASHSEVFSTLLRELRTTAPSAEDANILFHPGLDFNSLASTQQQEYFRAFALSLFDFMWRIYNDLDLHIAINRSHPQAEIWMNTFKRWTGMAFMKSAWGVYKDRYPASFRSFLYEQFNIS